MNNEMQIRCIIASIIVILFCISIYYISKSQRQGKQIKTLRTLLLMKRADKITGWPDDKTSKKILAALGLLSVGEIPPMPKVKPPREEEFDDKNVQPQYMRL